MVDQAALPPTAEQIRTAIVGALDVCMDMVLAGQINEMVIIMTTSSGMQQRLCTSGLHSAIGMVEMSKAGLIKVACGT